MHEPTCTHGGSERKTGTPARLSASPTAPDRGAELIRADDRYPDADHTGCYMGPRKRANGQAGMLKTRQVVTMEAVVVALVRPWPSFRL